MVSPWLLCVSPFKIVAGSQWISPMFDASNPKPTRLQTCSTEVTRGNTWLCWQWVHNHGSKPDGIYPALWNKYNEVSTSKLGHPNMKQLLISCQPWWLIATWYLLFLHLRNGSPGEVPPISNTLALTKSTSKGQRNSITPKHTSPKLNIELQQLGLEHAFTIGIWRFPTMGLPNMFLHFSIETSGFGDLPFYAPYNNFWVPKFQGCRPLPVPFFGPISPAIWPLALYRLQR